jgi:hypothetical protein
LYVSLLLLVGGFELWVTGLALQCRAFMSVA